MPKENKHEPARENKRGCQHEFVIHYETLYETGFAGSYWGRKQKTIFCKRCGEIVLDRQVS